jgi:hypothetical protein
MAYKNKSTISLSVFMVSNFFMPALIKNRLNAAVFRKKLDFSRILYGTLCKNMKQ